MHEPAAAHDAAAAVVTRPVAKFIERFHVPHCEVRGEPWRERAALRRHAQRLGGVKSHAPQGFLGCEAEQSRAHAGGEQQRGPGSRAGIAVSRDSDACFRCTQLINGRLACGGEGIEGDGQYHRDRAAARERLRGVSYEEIAQRGGGILSTVRAVRGASEQQLFDESAPRLASLLREGVTCVEIKSGYGLTLEDEAKMLRVARRLGHEFPVTVRTTLLAAHTVPPEYKGRTDEYLDVVAREWLPELHAKGLVDAVDIFCERIAFDTVHARRLFDAARALGLPVKAHAEQLANIGATRLATEFSALSCDHLEYAEAADVQALARSGTVAVVLPVAFYSLAAARKPPIDELRAAKARIAIASDCNPGSAPGASLLLAASMGTRLFDLTPEEALRGMTLHAAQALGMAAECGSLAPRLAADLAVWDVESLDEFGYWSGYNRCRAVVRGGRLVHGRTARG